MPKQFLIGLDLLLASAVVSSAECIKEAQVTKWEVIAGEKLVASRSHSAGCFYQPITVPERA